MEAPPEVHVLEAALHALSDPLDMTQLPALSRAVTRAADDLELVAEETSNRTLQKKLLLEIARARNAATMARKKARQAALTSDRSELLKGVEEQPSKDKESDAARLARQINDRLRRTTAIVSEEIDRSRAAGDVVEESTRRLRMTRDQHGRYGENLSSGADTLKSIRRSEVIANMLIIASFALFFMAAAYVTKRRIANSNLSTFVLRPGMTVVSLPVRIAGWMVRAISGGGKKPGTAQTGEAAKESSAQKADEALKAKEGREGSEVLGQDGVKQDEKDSEFVQNDNAEKETEDIGTESDLATEGGSCSASEDCKSDESREGTGAQDGLEKDEENRLSNQAAQHHATSDLRLAEKENAGEAPEAHRKVDNEAVDTTQATSNDESSGEAKPDGNERDDAPVLDAYTSKSLAPDSVESEEVEDSHEKGEAEPDSNIEKESES